MSAISLRDVWVEYGEQIVLERVNLQIAAGTFLSVVGPSGAGKSTFLRLILGQERPSRGSILIEGKPLPDEPGPDRGVVFQRYSVFPHLTVLGNVLIATNTQARSRAACSSALPSHRRWRASRGHSCSTSRSARSIPARVRRCIS
jgi:NitT/TauT family transport system ATP-binding protein